MNWRRSPCLILLLASVVVSARAAGAQARQTESHATAAEHHAPKRQKFAFYQGTSWIPEGRNPETGARQTILAPSYGLVYEYWLSPHFGVGTYNDLKLVNMQVEHSGGELVTRESILVLTGAVVWAPWHPWAFSIGPGIEIEHHENVWLGRVGAEYAFELPKDWELSLGASYELKEFYDSFGLGLTIGRRFGARFPSEPSGRPIVHDR